MFIGVLKSEDLVMSQVISGSLYGQRFKDTLALLFNLAVCSHSIACQVLY
jgi:hypothetical protein